MNTRTVTLGADRVVAVAAPHVDAVAAGERAIRAGGNALDAALAAAVALTVVYPHQCALGGDLIALVRTPTGETTAVVAAGTAPAAIDTVAGDWAEVPKHGAHAVTVPGIVAGWQAVHGFGATRPLTDWFEGASELAAAGTAISAGLARAIASRDEQVRADPGLRGVFTRDGDPLVEGDVLRQPALAATFERLAADPDDFYRGEIARSLVATLARGGGVHTEADFAAYRPVVAPAVSRDVDGATWSVAPPPSVGPILIGVVAGSDAGDPASVLDASLRGVAARAAHLGDGGDTAALLTLAAGVDTAPKEPRPQGDTACVTATDSDGWSVTIVQSVYMTFGASLMDPATGIVLHNRGSAFSTDPASPARIRPGARPPHTLCPAIVDTPEATLVAGCQGGRAQPWILAQLLPQALQPDSALDDVLAAPRWVVGDRDLGRSELTLVHEPGADAAVLARAASRALPIADFGGPADEAGHVQLVRVTRDGDATRIDAASDPRADGAAAVTSIPASV